MGKNQQFTLIDSKKSRATIIYPSDSPESEQYAARELQRYLQEITGAEVSLLKDSNVRKGKIKNESNSPGIADQEHINYIIIGSNRLLDQNYPGLDEKIKELDQDSFLLKTIDSNLIIAGDRPRGTLYGVYSFLEDYLGCRWPAADCEHVPVRETVTIPHIDKKQGPGFQFRDILYREAEDGDWAAKNRLNTEHPDLQEKHGGKLTYGLFVHSFYELLPPEEYYADHPEYFALHDGERRREKGQLCLSQPDVFSIVLNNLKQRIEQNPEADIFSVSQNDNAAYCECEDCRRIDEQEGSPSGSLLHFVNKIAREIEKDYPDIYIDTLAYWYTRKPPAHIEPHDNVIIRLCDIECCFLHPLISCAQNQSFVRDLKQWQDITERLHIWDYVVNFRHYLMPWPNLYVLQPNIQLFWENNVISLFEQGNRSGKGEFASLRSYLLARLMWNPRADFDRLIDEFLTCFYGRAAPPLREYIDLMHDRIGELPDYHQGIFDPPEREFFSGQLMNRAHRLIQEALRLADNNKIRNRVHLVEIQLDYVRMYLMKEEEAEGYKDFRKLFFKKAKSLNIPRITEWKDLEESRSEWKAPNND